MNDLLQLTGDIELMAAADQKPRRLNILAYNGDLMTVPGIGPVVIVLAGMELGTAVPILSDHRNELSSIIASGTPSVQNGTLRILASLADTEAARQVASLIGSGMSLQASVGAEVKSRRYVAAGETAQANGRTIKAGNGGFMLVEKSVLRETSVTPVGADIHTSVELAASLKGKKMEPENTPPGITPELQARREFDAREAERVSSIRNVCASFSGLTTEVDDPAAPGGKRSVLIESEAIRAGWDLNRTELQILRERRPKAPYGSYLRQPSSAPVGSASHIAAALMVRAGFSAAAEQEFGPHIMEQSRPLHSASLVDLCRASLQADHREIPHSRNEMIRAGISSGSMPYALGDSANKILSASYRAAPASWRSFAAVKSAANFHVQRAVRPSFFGDLEELAPAGAVKHAHYSEETYVWSIDTFAKMLRIDRHSIVNDDLGVFSEVIPAMAKSSARTLSGLVVRTILANGSSFWGTGHLNYFEGAATNLQASSLATALRMLRIQKDAEGNILDLTPSVLLVPPELEQTAKTLVMSATMQRITSVDNNPTANPFENVASVVVEPRLSDSSFTGYSATAWYLFSAPSDASVIVGFLDGNERPTIETFGLDHDINNLSIGWRIYHDFGCALGDYRASVKSKGAA